MSRFVSGGTTEDPAATTSSSAPSTATDEAWAKAQESIAATRAPAPRPGEQEGGKSLYETLQANKAAKQDAFEESTRLRNQFRSLDEDEVEFLDSVMESTRRQEAEVRREERATMEKFRKMQGNEGKEGAGPAEEKEDLTEGVDAGAWKAAGRKRRKGKEGAGVGGVKVRRTSTAEKRKQEQASSGSAEKRPETDESAAKEDAGLEKSNAQAAKDKGLASPKPGNESPQPRPSVGLGLAAYSSDEDE